MTLCGLLPSNLVKVLEYIFIEIKEGEAVLFIATYKEVADKG